MINNLDLCDSLKYLRNCCHYRCDTFPQKHVLTIFFIEVVLKLALLCWIYQYWECSISCREADEIEKNESDTKISPKATLTSIFRAKKYPILISLYKYLSTLAVRVPTITDSEILCRCLQRGPNISINFHHQFCSVSMNMLL